jgi:preprotein translocase subunit SecD
MRKSIERWIISLLFCVLAVAADAQINGVVIDNVTGDTIKAPTVAYKGRRIAVVGDSLGHFSIERHNGWTLTVSAVGYKSKQVQIKSNTPANMVVRLVSDTRQIDEVVVKSKKKSKYSRKNNPAVELMKRVIEAKKKTDLANHDFYQYNKYQKITLAVNDVSPEELENAQKRKMQWIIDQVELCPYNGKLILPISVDETVSQHLYRKSPRSEKDIIK